jgi:type IV pilus assembly protein PilP
VLVAGLLAAGCNQQVADAPSVQEYEQKRAELMKRTQEQRAMARKPDAAPEAGAGLVASGKGYEYNPTGKRDPFRSFVDEQKMRMAKHERGPLEQFDLNQLTVVAVVWGTERPRALVEDPSGRGYVVQIGTPIGKNDGMVLRIDDDSVLVRETYVDYLGAQTMKEIEMRTRPTMTQGG